MPSVTLDIGFRAHQLRAWQDQRRFTVRVWHRRAGKTWFSLVGQVIRCLEAPVDDWRAYYVGPTFRQTKGISWDLAKTFTRGLPGTKFNEQELRIDFHNGSRLQLLGAEQYDSLRGMYADDITTDETALVPSIAWSQVLSPMLADRKGRATFIGTPMGRMNLLFELYDYARTGGDPDWQADVLTYRDTNVLDPNEIERMRRMMSAEEFAQELECSWNAAIKGAYYQREMEQIEQEGRITRVAYDAQLPVTAALDLGWSDTLVTVFHQQIGTEHRIIDCRAYERTPIPDVVAHWRTLPYPVTRVLLPHDAKVRELGTGLSREEVFASLGCNVDVVPRQDVHEGIDIVRRALRHTWFDEAATRTLREALLAYRSEYDEVKRVHSTRPLHDWSSHYADAIRYLFTGVGVGLAGPAAAWPKRPTARLGVYV